MSVFKETKLSVFSSVPTGQAESVLIFADTGIKSLMAGTVEMESRIIAVRHGETKWNREEIIQGHLDSSLTSLGKKQALAAAEGLKYFKIDSFYASDQGRAVNTAGIISEAIGMGFKKTEKLRERAHGIFQGLTREEIRNCFPEDAAKYENRDFHFKMQGGESIGELTWRAVSCLQEIAFENMGKTALVVTHGGVLVALFNHVFDIVSAGRKKYSVKNGSLSGFIITDQFEWKLEFWNDTGHLRRMNIDSLEDE